MYLNQDVFLDDLNRRTGNKYKTDIEHMEITIFQAAKHFTECINEADRPDDADAIIYSVEKKINDDVLFNDKPLMRSTLKDMLKDYILNIEPNKGKEKEIEKIIEDSIDNVIQREKKEKIRDNLQSVLDTAKDDLRAGKSLDNVFEGLNPIIELENDYRENKKTLPFKDFLAQKKDNDESRTADLLGYKLAKFNALCSNIDGLQAGFYLISAATNVGKTAFICNLALDCIESNENTTVIYFSLDDSRSIIVNRMIAIKSGISINKVQDAKTISNDLKINEAYQFLVDNNIDIVDSEEIRDIIQLEKKIRLEYKCNKNLIVFIDGLYNLDVKSNSTMIRDVNIERANQIKRIVDIYQIPIIMTGELLKSKDKSEPSLSSIMESGKYIYNSNLILLLHDKTGTNQAGKSEPTYNIELLYAKNKLSHFKGKQDLIFKSRCSIFKESEAGKEAGEKEIITEGKKKPWGKV